MMSKYDYNKGYRGFHFQKNAAIDRSLPPLCSYRSTREMSSLLWMTNAEHVANNMRGHVHGDPENFHRTANETTSLHLPIILASSISSVSNASASVMEGVEENKNLKQVHVTKNAACSVHSPTPTLLLGSEDCKNVVSHKFGTKATTTHKTRVKAAIPKPARNKERMDSDSQKRLADCLFIQNGIQCFPPSSRNRFLSTEKEKDIKEWINRSARNK